MKRPRICKASIALASDGSLVANVHGFAGEKDPEELLRGRLKSAARSSSA